MVNILLDNVDNLISIIAMLGVFFEITPIKINPISSLLRYIGAKLNEDVIAEVASMKEEIIDEKHIKNGQIDIEYAFIEKLYNRCLEENSFLCANGDDDC